MRPNRTDRRRHGTGSILEKNGRYYGQWRVNGKVVKRSLGAIRQPGSREGLTKTQAEARLREVMAEVVDVPVTARVTVQEGGDALVARVRRLGRKKSTVEGYESFVRVHLAPYFGDKPLARIKPKDIETYITTKQDEGCAVKSIKNHVGVLHGIFEVAIRERWATSNPCKLVDKPREVDQDDADIRFLDGEELEALLRAVPNDDLGRMERVLYLAGAMTGMRQGELLALRWREVDWLAHRVRVRRNYVRGEYGTPKSKRSSRSVPLADRLATELEALSKSTAFAAADDLVFGHPHTGKPYDRSKLLKRFKAAVKAAGLTRFVTTAIDEDGEEVEKVTARFHDLRHTFGTRMAAASVPMRTLQEWMGHKDFKTTLIYSDYMPGANEADVVNAAFGGINEGIKPSESRPNSDALEPGQLAA